MVAQDSWTDEVLLLKRSMLREVNAGIRAVAEDLELMTGPEEWEFLCECGERDCHAWSLLTLPALIALREQGEPVLATGHSISPPERGHR